MHWYFGPWTFGGTRPVAAWRGPAGCVASFDLRPLPQQAQVDGIGFGVFLCAATLAGREHELLGAGHWDEVKATDRIRKLLAVNGYQPEGETLRQMLFDIFTAGADPSGLDRPLPLMPNGKLQLELGCPGLRHTERFAFGVHAHTDQVRAVLQRDLAAVAEFDVALSRKALDYECIKYGLRGGDAWKELLPPLLRNEHPGPSPHATAIADNFNRANSANLGSSSEGWSWTEFGQLDLVTNAVQAAATSVIGDARADSSLSGADHYAQIDIIASSVSGADGAWSPLVRFSASARTYYSGEVYEGSGVDDAYLLKTVAGTRTVLAGPTTVTNSVPQSWRLTINGSSLVLSQAGVDRLSVTDTAITGNLRTGIFAFAAGTNAAAIRIDNFVAADLPVSIAANHTEAAEADDTLLATKAAIATLTAAAEAADSQAASLGAGEIAASLSAAASANAATSATAVLLAAIAAAAEAGEVSTAQAALLAATVSAAAASDAFAAVVVKRTTVTEAAAASDVQACSAVLRASTASAAAAGSTFSGLASIAASVLAAAEAGDVWTEGVLPPVGLRACVEAVDVFTPRVAGEAFRASIAGDAFVPQTSGQGNCDHA